MAKKSASLDDGGATQKCPGCGRKCLYFKQWDCGDFFAVHSIIEGEIKTKDGASFKANKMGDCCDRNGPVKRHS